MGSYWSLFLLGSIYMVGELGHFLLGAVSRSMAQDVHYGDKGCLKLPSLTEVKSDICTKALAENICGQVEVTLTNGTEVSACTWDYTGLGLEYHILAGPAFVAVFTITGLVWGYLADKFNRVLVLSIATFMFSIAICGTAFSTKYWHVVLSRMALGASESSCTPLASGILADMFPKSQRGLALGFFHWGIYIGYGLSYTVGNYVTAANIFGQGWRASYVLSGLPGIVLAVLFYCTAKDPPRTKNEDELDDDRSEGRGKSDPNHNNFTSNAELDSHLTNANATSSEAEGSTLTILRSTNSQIIKAKVSKSEVEVGACSGLKNGLRIGWNIIKNPAIIFLLVGSCVRHAAGFCWGYNSALYFKTYYPDYDASIWLTAIAIGSGVTGTIVGGYLSDRLVSRLGISARALVLATSQLLAAPFAFAIFFTEPPLALFAHLLGYMAAEMWFGVMFAILVELVPSDIRSKAVATALFCINNVGGNTPVFVDPIARLTSYRTAVIMLYPGALLTSSVLFFTCFIILRAQGKK